jgi:hypothetical protein
MTVLKGGAWTARKFNKQSARRAQLLRKLHASSAMRKI